MKIGIFGNENLAEELRSNPMIKEEIRSFSNWNEVPGGGDSFDIFFLFHDFRKLPVAAIQFILSSVSLLGLNTIHGSSLTQIQGKPELLKSVFGFIGLGGFLSRGLWEIGIPEKEMSKSHLEKLAGFGIEPLSVLDRVGLISGRVLGMIINEAYFTVMEGTANKEDIDIAMKLGTNYPKGPFEMADLAGQKNLLSLLDNLFLETREERYKPCPMLRDEALKSDLQEQ